MLVMSGELGVGAVPGQSLQVITRLHTPRARPAMSWPEEPSPRIIGEDSPSRLDRSREDGLPKSHVICEGQKGHVCYPTRGGGLPWAMRSWWAGRGWAGRPVQAL